MTQSDFASRIRGRAPRPERSEAEACSRCGVAGEHLASLNRRRRT